MPQSHLHAPSTIHRRLWLGQLACGLAASSWLGRVAAAGPQPAPSIAAQFGRLPAPAALQRVFAAGPPAGVLLATLAPHKLLGWPMRLSAQARTYLSPELAALPHLGRLSGRGSTMPLEALLQLQPDLVLDSGTADATYVSAARRLSEQTGLACVLVQGSMAEHAAQLLDIGRLLGVEERAQRLASYARETAQLAHAVTDSLAPGKRPRVYFGRGPDGLETGLQDSINVELVTYAGGLNVAAQAGRGNLTRVSMEQILAWDPEVIVTQEPDFARRVRSDPVWRGVAAVRTGRIHCAPILPFGWLDGPPSVNRLIGVRWLLEHLHPGHAHLRQLPALAQAVQRFYALFYGITLSPAATAQLLATAQ